MRVWVCELTRGSWPESQREMTYNSTRAEADIPQRHDGAEECTGDQEREVVSVLHDNIVEHKNIILQSPDLQGRDDQAYAGEEGQTRVCRDGCLHDAGGTYTSS